MQSTIILRKCGCTCDLLTATGPCSIKRGKCLRRAVKRFLVKRRVGARSALTGLIYRLSFLPLCGRRAENAIDSTFLSRSLAGILRCKAFQAAVAGKGKSGRFFTSRLHRKFTMWLTGSAEGRRTQRPGSFNRACEVLMHNVFNAFCNTRHCVCVYVFRHRTG